MEKKEQIGLFIFAFIGCVADVIAIILAISSQNIALPLFVIALFLTIIVISYLYLKYKERCDFIGFVQYLFNNLRHNFNLLPKICLELDKSKEINKLSVQKLNIKYTFDMQKIINGTLLPDSHISYYDTIEYSLEVVNKDIPKEFVIYRGNMKADDLIIIKQKHGIQSNFEVVPPPRYTDETRTDVTLQRYSWQLKKENITSKRPFPLSFIFKYSEHSTANSNDTIILYPYQIAKNIEMIDFTIEFLCEKVILKKVELFKVWKDGNRFKQTPIPGVKLMNNVAFVQILPESSPHEAYYFRLYWELV